MRFGGVECIYKQRRVRESPSVTGGAGLSKSQKLQKQRKCVWIVNSEYTVSHKNESIAQREVLPLSLPEQKVMEEYVEEVLHQDIKTSGSGCPAESALGSPWFIDPFTILQSDFNYNSLTTGLILPSMFTFLKPHKPSFLCLLLPQSPVRPMVLFHWSWMMGWCMLSKHTCQHSCFSRESPVFTPISRPPPFSYFSRENSRNCMA